MISLKERKFITIIILIFIISIIGYLAYSIGSVLDYPQQVQLYVFLATAGSFLSYVLFTIWDKYIERPELIFLHNNEPEFQDFYFPQIMIFFGTQPNAIIRELRFLRVIVHNRGSRTAKRCLARIQLLQRPPQGNHTLSREQKTLIWPDVMEFPNIPPGSSFALNIAYSGREIHPNAEPTDLALPLIGACDGFVRAWICTREALENPNIRAQDALCLGRFKLKLSVFADDAQPSSCELALNVSTNWQDFNMQILSN